METAAADAEALPFVDAGFELVTCRIAPHHFPDVSAFVRESWRVLKPGGTFALVDNVSPDRDTTPGFTDAEYAEAAAGYNAFEKLRDPSHGRALSTTEWLGLMARSGFAVLHSEHAPKAMEFAAWCRNMGVAEATAATLRSMLEGAALALRSYLQPRTEDGKLTFTLVELIALARKP